MVSGRPVLGLILKGYPRISETFISNEIYLLERRGLPIHIFSMRRPREDFTHGSVTRIQAPVDYLPSTMAGNLHRLVGPNLKTLLRRPKRYGRAIRLAWRRYKRNRKTATFKHLLQAGYLVGKLLPGSGVTRWHAHFAHSPTSVAMFASILSGLPFGFTAHAKDIYTSHPDQLAEKIEAADLVVTCTEYNRRHLAELASGASTPIHSVYHGIDLDLFAAPPDDRAPQPPYRLMTVARLTEKKGLPTVLQAVRRLVDQGLDVRHLLIGDGDDREAVLGLIDRLGLGEVVHWGGTMPHEAVVEHFRQTDAFVLGCQIAGNGDRDGIPNVLVESMSMGVPVVATDVSAIPELVDHESSGLLVPPHRPDLLADALVRALTDHELRSRIVPAAREKVRRSFDNRRNVDHLADVFHRHGYFGD
jgi:glycosyltransferase involved in cell wall biosynthesis